MSEETGDRSGPEVGAQFGKYRIIRRIGHGAFGSVYEAVLPGAMGFSKQVAIKRLRANRAVLGSAFVKALVNEARIGGLLHHANIVDVLEFDQVGPHYYIAMEFIDGVTLAEVTRLCRKRRVLLPRFAVIDIAIQACRGLQYAHERRDPNGQPLNVIHRDLKPSNIMVDLEGTVKICDFGIAKATSNLFNETATGHTKGTPRYMSPDQLCAEETLLPRSDVFSLGSVLFELITTRPLFVGDSLPALTHQIVFGDIRDRLLEAEQALPGCGRLLERALQRDPEERYQDVASLGEEFRQLSRRYPPEAELSQVIDRFVRVVDRTESREIQGSHELDFDDSDTRVFSESIDESEVDDSAPISVPGPDSSGWTRFTSVFLSASSEAPTSRRPANTHSGVSGTQPPPTWSPSESFLTRTQAPTTDYAPRSRSPLLYAFGLLGLLLASVLLVGGGFGLYALGRLTVGRGAETTPVEADTSRPALVGLPPDAEDADANEAAGSGPGAVEMEQDGADAVAEELPTGPEEPATQAEEPTTQAEEPATQAEEPRTESPRETTEPEESSPTPSAAGGEIRFYVEPWAEIYLDGAFKGTGQRPSEPYAVTGGAHTLRLVCDHEGCPEGGREKSFRLWVDGDSMQVDGRPVSSGKNWFCWDFATMGRCD